MAPVDGCCPLRLCVCACACAGRWNCWPTRWSACTRATPGSTPRALLGPHAALARPRPTPAALVATQKLANTEEHKASGRRLFSPHRAACADALLETGCCAIQKASGLFLSEDKARFSCPCYKTAL